MEMQGDAELRWAMRLWIDREYEGEQRGGHLIQMLKNKKTFQEGQGWDSIPMMGLRGERKHLSAESKQWGTGA